MPVDITATKPASQPGNPSWATNGGTRVAPTLGQKQTGWTNAQRPPFNVFNWLLGFLADWAKYLEDATDELDADKLSVNGVNGMVGDLFPTADNASNNGGSVNRWSTIWGYVLDVATKVVIGATMILTDKLLTLAATADADTVARKNTITTRSMTKARIFVEISSGGTPSIVDGFAVGTISNEGLAASGIFSITWATPFANASYQVNCTFEEDANSVNLLVRPISIHGTGGTAKTASKCFFQLRGVSGTAYDYSGSNPAAPIFLSIEAGGLQ